MSNKRHVQRQKHAKKVEKQGRQVVIWIAVGLIALAVVYLIAMSTSMS